jgi:hypothetical protein
MRKTYLLGILSLAVLSIAFSVPLCSHAASENPFQIASAEQLVSLSNDSGAPHAMGGLSGHAPISPALPQDQGKIMQFQSGGHILGFGSDRVYMVGLGYALIEEFVGASQVTPVSGSSAKPGLSDDAGKGDEPARLFQGVTYPGLWKGITLRYDRASGGLAESVYVVQPGADVNDIRVRYNTDFRIGGDGDLRFRHPTKRGYYTLSRPVACRKSTGNGCQWRCPSGIAGTAPWGFPRAYGTQMSPLSSIPSTSGTPSTDTRV